MAWLGSITKVDSTDRVNKRPCPNQSARHLHGFSQIVCFQMCRLYLLVGPCPFNRIRIEICGKRLDGSKSHSINSTDLNNCLQFTIVLCHEAQAI